MSHLKFQLEIEDGWPPVAVESLPCTTCPEGFRIEAPPLFIGDLSVGDIISARFESGHVIEWSHVSRSRRSVVWIMDAKRAPALQRVLGRCRRLGCGTTGGERLGLYSIDVPESVDWLALEEILEALDSEDHPIAYPSLRH